MGAFSAKFSTTPSGETTNGTQKSLIARTSSITMQNLVVIERRTSVWEHEVWCFSLFLKILYVCNAPALNGHKWRSCVIEEKKDSVGVLGRFRCGLQIFSETKSPLQRIKQIWKLSLGGATISAQMRDKIFKIWENRCKVCAHHFDHLEASLKKTSTTAFYPMYCRCAPV